MHAEIIIDELIVNTIIGIHSHERNNKQPLCISLSFQYDIEKATQNDDMNNAIDYDALSKKIKKHVELKAFKLIETCAKSIANLILENENIQKVSLFVYKPNALKNAKRVGIKLIQEQTNKSETITNKLLWS